MEPDAHSTARRAALAVALAAATALAFAGCAAPGTSAPPTTEDSIVSDSAGDSGPTDDDTGSGASAPVMPDDFPHDDILLPDGELISATGTAGSWVIVKRIQLVDQVTAAVNIHVKSYGFTIDEHIDDEQPSWTLSSDRYALAIDVRAGEPYTMTYVVEARQS